LTGINYWGSKQSNELVSLAKRLACGEISSGRACKGITKHDVLGQRRIVILKSSMERGLPISLSRMTDVAHWYMPWLQDMMMVKGIIPATDPKSVTLSFWKADPDNIHSLFFWTKYPPKLTTALQTWLSPYRVFTAVTITGWSEVETRVPPLEDQMQAFESHMELVGIEKMCWRYSPVPNDFGYNAKRQDDFAHICYRMSEMGLTEVDVSLLQPSPHWNKGYALDGQDEMAARQSVLLKLVDIASEFGIEVGVCADDLKVSKSLPTIKAVRQTKCLNKSTIDKVFGLQTEEILENGCGCQLSLDPCHGKQFGCASGCKYCYVSFTKM